MWRWWLAAVLMGCGGGPDGFEGGLPAGRFVDEVGEDDGEPDEAPIRATTGGSIECDEPAPGCPCDTPAERMDCGTVYSEVGGKTVCGPGESVCTQGAWSECVINFAAQ